MSTLLWMIALPALAAGFLGVLGSSLLEPLIRRMPHAADRRLGYLMLGALPLLLGYITAFALIVLASSKAMGWIVDHCVLHGTVDHPHLCLEHLPAIRAGVIPWLIALMVVLPAIARLAGWISHQNRVRHSVRVLSALSKPRGPVSVVANDTPTAFVGGIRNPRIFISNQLLGLLSLRDRRIVVAHESAHLRSRDPLWRTVLEILLVLHRPACADAIRVGWIQAAEECADAKVAGRFGSTDTALALLRVLRLTGGARAGTVSCIQGASPMARIVRLQEGTVSDSRQVQLTILTASACLTIAAAVLALHHPIETAFGLLIP